MDLLEALRSGLDREGLVDDRRPLLVAFSGGRDSTALLGALTSLSGELDLRLLAAHLDHGLDPDSERRAERARATCAHLDVPIVIERRSRERDARSEHGGESLEARARRARYSFLEEMAWRIARCGFSISEIPIVFEQRRAGASNAR